MLFGRCESRVFHVLNLKDSVNILLKGDFLILSGEHTHFNLEHIFFQLVISFFVFRRYYFLKYTEQHKCMNDIYRFTAYKIPIFGSTVGISAEWRIQNINCQIDNEVTLQIDI
jgi:hypothetical protein